MTVLLNKNGIPVDIFGLRKKDTRLQTSQILHNDFQKFHKFATMTGVEDGYSVTVIVPIMHEDFKT